MNTWKFSGLPVKRRSELKNEPGKDTLSKKIKEFANKQLLDNLSKVYLNIFRTYTPEEQSKPKNRPSYRIRPPLGQNTFLSLISQEEI
jgi:hypothetical protein